MINYQYQILKYMPDQVNEEFVNLGVVVLHENGRLFKSRFIEKATRVSAFFPDVNIWHLNNTLNFLEAEFLNVANKLPMNLHLEETRTLDEITGSVLPKDDSALIFSDVKKGRDVNTEIACDDLFERLVLHMAVREN